MKKIALFFLVAFTVFTIPQGYGQEIDTSMIQDLSSDQIETVKKAIDRTEKL